MKGYPEVRRIHETEHIGSHIEPPLDPFWSDIDKLRWHAAVASLDTGLRFLVHEMDGCYSIQIENNSMSARPYHEAWSYISAASVGATIANRKASE